MDTLSLINAVCHDLTPSELGAVTVAICALEHGRTADVSGLSPEARIVCRIAEALIEEEEAIARMKREAAEEKRKAISAARSAAGKMGGRPRLEEGSEKQKKQKKQIAFLLFDDENSQQSNTLDNNSKSADNNSISDVEKMPKKQKKQKKQIAFLLSDEKNAEIDSTLDDNVKSVETEENTAQKSEEKKQNSDLLFERPKEEPSLLPPTPPIITPVEKKEKKEIRDNKLSLTKKTKETDFSFVDRQDFLPVLQEWLDYKKQRGQTYKPIGLKQCYNKLVELSNGDPEFAKKYIVEFSIASNYAGLFVDKTQQREKVARKRESDTPLDVNSRYNPDDFNF